MAGGSVQLIDVRTDITENVWKLVAKVGDQLAEGDTILILESMKMEIPIAARLRV